MVHVPGGHYHGIYGHHYHPLRHGWHRFGGPRRWQWRRPGWAGPMPSQLVSWAQGCLTQVLGTQLPQDGLMGPDTQQAIQQFQSQQQLPPTGALDSNTVAALQAACSGQQAMQNVPAPPPPQPAPPPAPPAAPQQAPHPRHAQVQAQQATEFEEGAFESPGDQAPKQSRSGRWVRHRGRIILFGI
jgi:Putative peptidoglycan binding domain